MQLVRTAIWVGLAVAAANATAEERDLGLSSKYANDPRLIQLEDFLKEKRCPVRNLAPDFIAAADKHNLDWRLLPSIAIVESGCGRYSHRNNIFGWASARKGFETIRAGIYAVAERLANSKLYRNKTLDALLRVYNRHTGYGARVKRLMLDLDSDAPLRAHCFKIDVLAPAPRRLPPQEDPALHRPVLDVARAPALPAAWLTPELGRTSK